MYAQATQTHRTDVTKNTSTKALQLLWSWNSVAGVITQTQETSTEEWFGLSKTDAEGLMESSETSTLNGATRNYLGSARLVFSPGIGGASCYSPSCWGTKKETQINRMGETNLYHVTKTTTVYTVQGRGDNCTLTLE